MPIALQVIKNELVPGLFDVRGHYDMIPRQWDKVFITHKSNMAVERSTQMAFLGLPFLKTEGAQTQFDNEAGERFVWNMEPYEVALGYAITRKAILNNLYRAQFNPTNLKLADSFAQFKEIQAASIFNTGTVAITGLGGDNQPLFSNVHPMDTGSWSNIFATPLSLNESSLLQMQINVRTGFFTERGLRVLSRMKRLVVPAALDPVAARLLKTELRPGTADNDINAILSTAGGIPDGHIVLDFLTSNFAWFGTTNIEGLIHLQRVPFEMDMWVDNITDNLLVKGYEYFGFFYNDPRCAFASYPTS